VKQGTRKIAPSSATPRAVRPVQGAPAYDGLVGEIGVLLEQARRTSARAVNSIMTATYWEIGRRIVEFEQQGRVRAEYGETLLERLAQDLSARFGRGFSYPNVNRFRQFYLAFPRAPILSTPSRESDRDRQASPEASSIAGLAARFSLPWSAYVRLLSVRNESARAFYEAEALRGGWSVRQLDRQIGSQFYERTALSRNKAAMLRKGAIPRPEDVLSPEEEVKDPYVLEFLRLKDEYSETDMEEALIRHLETFLLELGADFCFAGRQRRLRIGDEWYRVDLVFYHRRLRCLVLIDLKLDRFTHADAGQMHTYLNYAAEHWTQAGENPPVGLILCAQKDAALARYALDNLPNKVLAAEYRTVLPDEKLLADDLEKTRRMLEMRGIRRARK
jgi:predicted nuclease of restriction endonuclease-like (RecB) superfamily